MDEPPADALRRKKDSSMRVAINLVKSGGASEVVAGLRAELSRLMAETGLTPDRDAMPIDAGIKKALPDQKIR